MSNLSTFAGGRPVAYKRTLIAGSGTWNVPALIYGTQVLVTMIGAGGSGRAGGATDGMLGGAGGEYIQRVGYAFAAGTNYSTGIGGAAVSATNDGNPGGSTTFGTLTVDGGSGGNNSMTGIVGTHGFIYDSGGNHFAAKNSAGLYAAPGGASSVNGGVFGGGGGLLLYALVHSSDGIGGHGYGAGGAGVATGTSGAGKAGVILLEWYEYVV